MSVINQMLQDLDRRRASTAERAVLPRQARVLPQPAKTRRSRWLMIAVPVLAASAAGGWVAMDRDRVAPVPYTAASAPPTPISKPQATTVPTANVVTAEPKAPAPAKQESAAPVVTIEKQPSIANGDKRPVPKQKIANAAAEPELLSSPAPRPPAPAPVARAAERPVVAPARTTAAPTDGKIEKRSAQLTPEQLADEEYREGAARLSQGAAPQAQDKFRAALQHNPAHAPARQALLGLLLNAKKLPEAEQLLREGLAMNPRQPGFAMALARLQIERNDTASAIETLEKTSGAAASNPDYAAFHAALLQRQSRHAEAVEQYQHALSLAPRSGVWLMGLGISLQALGKSADAQEAFRRARATQTLTPELQAFVDQRIAQLAR